MTSFVANFLETTASALGQLLKNSAPDYIDVEAPDSEFALAMRDGSLVSGLKIEGLRQAVGPEEFVEVCRILTRSLSALLAKPGHTVDLFISRDPEGAALAMDAFKTQSMKACETIGLDMGDVVSANAKEIAKYTAAEEVYLAFWSRESVLSKRDAADGRAENRAHAAKAVPIRKTSQFPFGVVHALREIHNAAVDVLKDEMGSAGLMVSKLNCHEMLRVARLNIDPDFTPADWKPLLLGDTLPILTSPGEIKDGQTDFDVSDIQVPGIPRQLFPRDAQKRAMRYLDVGERSYAPVMMEIPPRDILPFDNMFQKLVAAQIPWRAMFRIDGGGLKFLGTKSLAASVLSLGSASNREVCNSIDQLKAVDFQLTNVRFRASFCTWAPASNAELLGRRASRLAQSISAWGRAEVVEVTGDPMLGAISSIPFISSQCGATASVAPLPHIVRMMPIFRPASPWTNGANLFRSRDGKLMPFQPGSVLQTTWMYIFMGKPGKGKSVQMLNMLLSGCMAPGTSRLPRMAILDIGPSSSYFVDTLRQSLPKDRQHECQSFKLRLSPEYAINFFDTFPGCRFPTPEQKSQVVNLLCQIATPAEATKPYERISELVSMVIDDVYEMYSDRGAKSRPKRYSLGANPIIDKVLADLNYQVVPQQTTWWNVTDYLASKGLVHESGLAQRYAVPTLADCSALTSNVRDLFEEIQVSSGQSLPSAFQSLVSSATRDFPILSMPTAFDISNVRIASINLEEVAKGSGGAALRQTAIMYMLAGYALTKMYRLDYDVVKALVEKKKCPELYGPILNEYVNQIKEDMKWVVFDEFHRTSQSPNVQESVALDAREGRKYKIGLALSSQGAGDFPPLLKEFATGIFIVDCGTHQNSDQLQEYFGFNNTAKQLLRDYAHGPTSQGTPVLVHLDTKKGPFTQLVYSTLGIETRWALSTTSEDGIVRRALADRLGAGKARKALAHAFPGGGVADFVERLKSEGNPDGVALAIKRGIEVATAQAVAD
jgi:intracellular multiplication protein IcmB